MLSNCGIGEDSWEPLNSKEIKPANPKGNQLWLFTGRTDAEAPILRLPDAKSWLTVKDSNAGKDWGQEEKKPRKDEMVGWPHHLNGHGFEQTPGDSEGQGSLACCSPWGHKESDTIEGLNNKYSCHQNTKPPTHDLSVLPPHLYAIGLCIQFLFN